MGSLNAWVGGALVEGDFGAVIQFVGDGLEVELMAADGDSYGKVSADKPVGVFVGSSLPWALGVSERHLHALVEGQALVAGHFPGLDPSSVCTSPRREGPGCGESERHRPGRLSCPGAGAR